MSIGKHKTLETCMHGKCTPIDCVEISIDPSNGQNELEPKILGLGFAKSLVMLTKIRYKYDVLKQVLKKCTQLDPP